MSTRGSIGSPTHEGRDEWTMVNRVSELIENGDMSDISLPPLPTFGTCEVGSLDGSISEDTPSSKDGSRDPSQGIALRRSTEAADWSSASDSSSEEPLDGRRRSGALSADGGGRRGASGARERGSGASSRRSSVRSARARAERTEREMRLGAPFASPTPSPRRRTGRVRRSSGRRTEWKTSDLSPSASFSSSGASYERGSRSFSSPAWSIRELRRGDLRASFEHCDSLDGYGGASETRADDRVHGRGNESAGGGNGLEPFSLEDVTTIGPSETVSLTSSRLRRGEHEDDGEGAGAPYKWSPGRGSRAASSAKASPASVASRNDGSVVVVDGCGGSTENDLATSELARDADSNGSCDRRPVGEEQQQQLEGADVHGREVLGPISRQASLEGSQANSTGRYSTTSSQLSCGSDYASSEAVSAPGGRSVLRVASPGTAMEQEAEPRLGKEATEVICSEVAVISTRALTRDVRAESGAWSVSSLAGGTAAPVSRLFAGGVGGGATGGVDGAGTPADWDVGSAGLGRGTGSFLGYSSFKLAVLEARADAAEEQGEFWERRARIAEQDNHRLKKLVSEQYSRILELERRLVEVSEAAAGNRSVGVSDEAAYQPSGDGIARIGEPSGESSTRSVLASAERTTTRSPDRDVDGRVDEVEQNTFHGGEAGDGLQESCVVPTEVGGATTALSSVPRSSESAEGAAETEEATTDGDDDDDVEGEVARALERIGGIAFTRFCVGTVAMFFPTPENNFLAFNVGYPGHFLSKESQALIGRDEHFRPYYVLGRIIEIQDVICCESNPFKLPSGHQIKVVYVETISSDLQAAGLQTRSVEV